AQPTQEGGGTLSVPPRTQYPDRQTRPEDLLTGRTASTEAEGGFAFSLPFLLNQPFRGRPGGADPSPRDAGPAGLPGGAAELAGECVCVKLAGARQPIFPTHLPDFLAGFLATPAPCQAIHSEPRGHEQLCDSSVGCSSGSTAMGAARPLCEVPLQPAVLAQ